VAHVSLRAGVQCLLQTCGLGKMQPNILLMGYKNKWLRECQKDCHNFSEYVGVLADAFESNMSVCVFRNENQGLDHSALLSEEDRLFVRLPDLLLSDKDSSLNDDLSRGVVPKMVRPKATRQLTAEITRSKSDLHLPQMLVGHRHASENIESSSGSKNKRPGGKKHLQLNNKFRTKVRGGLVDVWWLFEDGGLTLLLSHLLTTQNTYLPNAKMRVFTVCSKSSPELVQHSVVQMLKKFRIHASAVLVLSEEEHRELYPETMEEYVELMAVINPPGEEPAIEHELLAATHQRTMRYLRHRELLLEYSSASSVIIMWV
jgi:solute carrier family 12 (sodium/potassium/chloride transporter), member 2